jgi:dipeptidase E
VRLYLSSFRLGRHAEQLVTMVGSGRRTALIPNALDAWPPNVRRERLQSDIDELSGVGLQVTVADLTVPGVTAGLAGFDLVWTRGGNVFVLRRALADAGADLELCRLIEDDVIVYGGYSAGACVLARDLSALAAVDDLTEVKEPITVGLGLLDRPFVPHVDSPRHPETVACDEIAATYRSRGEQHWAVRDGEVLVVDRKGARLLT